MCVKSNSTVNSMSELIYFEGIRSILDFRFRSACYNRSSFALRIENQKLLKEGAIASGSFSEFTVTLSYILAFIQHFFTDLKKISQH